MNVVKPAVSIGYKDVCFFGVHLLVPAMLQTSRPQSQLLTFLSRDVSQSPKLTSSKLLVQRFTNCLPRTAGDFTGRSHKKSTHISLITVPSDLISIIFIFIFSFTPHPIHNRPWVYFQYKPQIIKYLCFINKSLSFKLKSFILFCTPKVHFYLIGVAQRFGFI